MDRVLSPTAVVLLRHSKMEARVFFMYSVAYVSYELLANEMAERRQHNTIDF